MDCMERFVDTAMVTEAEKERVKAKIRNKARAKKALRAQKNKEYEEADAMEQKKAEAKRLRLKLLEVSEANDSLAKAVDEKNNEIANLKRSVQSLNEVLNSVPIDELRCNSSIASTKILELSQKNRQLRAEIETTKNRVCKKDQQIQKLERELKNAREKFQQDADLLRRGNNTPIDEMQSKINSLQQKFFETRNKNLELTNQLKIAQKCLQQEVGESFNLNLLASNAAASNWRGRAQQILLLQQKVHELKERLELQEQHPPGLGANFAFDSAAPTPPISGGVKLSDNDCPQLLACISPTFDRLTPSVRKSELTHRQKVEALEKQIADLNTQLEEQRGKIFALKVRNKTLNDEVIKHKMKASTLEEQTDFNGMNLATMNEKLNTQKHLYEKRLEEMAREMAETARQRERAMYKEDELLNKLDNMEEAIIERDEEIVQLKAKIEHLEEDLRAVCGGYLFKCRELRKEEFITILDSLESEKNRLIELNRTLMERHTQERNKSQSLGEQVARQKIHIGRLDAKLRELEKELQMHAERKKRSQRIADYANSISATTLNQNQSMGTFIFENSSRSMLSDKTVTAPEIKQPQVAELKNQLELAEEKIKLLEDKITVISQEKEVDVKTFEEIILNTKNLIMESFVNYRRAQENGEQLSITEASEDIESRFN